MTTLDFQVVGDPAPQGSKKYVGNGIMVESSKKLKPWRQAVTDAARDARDITPGWEQPAAVGAVITYRFHRPRSHYRTGSHAHELRPNAPIYHAVKPDVDKLQRSTFDPLTDLGVIRDDCRIADVHAVKVYVGDADWTGAEVSLFSLDLPVLA